MYVQQLVDYCSERLTTARILLEKSGDSYNIVPKGLQLLEYC